MSGPCGPQAPCWTRKGRRCVCEPQHSALPEAGFPTCPLTLLSPCCSLEGSFPSSSSSRGLPGLRSLPAIFSVSPFPHLITSAFPPELSSDLTSCRKPALASTAVPPQSGPALCYLLWVSSSLVPPSTIVTNGLIRPTTAPYCPSPLLEGKSPKGRGRVLVRCCRPSAGLLSDQSSVSGPCPRT